MQFPILPWRVLQKENVAWAMHLRHMVLCKRRKFVTKFQTSGWFIKMRTFLKGIMWRSRKFKKIRVISGHKNIDHYWSEVCKICNKNSIKNYPQLFSLVKCILTFKSWQQCPRKEFIYKLLVCRKTLLKLCL